jgi:hypothetical protein
MRIKRRVNLQYSKVDTWTVAQLGSFYGEHRNQFLVHASRILKDKV